MGDRGRDVSNGGRATCVHSPPAAARVAAPAVLSRGSVAMAYVGISQSLCLTLLGSQIRCVQFLVVFVTKESNVEG